VNVGPVALDMKLAQLPARQCQQAVPLSFAFVPPDAARLGHF